MTPRAAAAVSKPEFAAVDFAKERLAKKVLADSSEGGAAEERRIFGSRRIARWVAGTTSAGKMPFGKPCRRQNYVSAQQHANIQRAVVS